MADIFHEIDEDVRRERLYALWQRYGALAVGLVLLVIVGIGGWRTYEWWQGRQAAQTGAAFESALNLEAANKTDEAIADFKRIATESQGGYRVLARLQEANALAPRDTAAALKAYDAIADDRGVGATMQDLARVRAALLVLGTASLDEMRSRLEPLTAPDRPFRHTARELLALAALRAGDASAVQRWADMIVADPESPDGIRQRAAILLALAAPEAKS